MSSEKIAELDLEAKLKDWILSHARAVYGGSHPTGTFDVVFEKESKTFPKSAYSLVAYRPHLIVYELPDSNANWTLVLSVQRRQSIAEGMGVLLEILREKMAAVMRTVSLDGYSFSGQILFARLTRQTEAKKTLDTEWEGYNPQYDPFCVRIQFMSGVPMGPAVDAAFMNSLSSRQSSWDSRSNQPSPRAQGVQEL